MSCTVFLSVCLPGCLFLSVCLSVCQVRTYVIRIYVNAFIGYVLRSESMYVIVLCVRVISVILSVVIPC